MDKRFDRPKCDVFGGGSRCAAALDAVRLPRRSNSKPIELFQESDTVSQWMRGRFACDIVLEALDRGDIASGSSKSQEEVAM